MAKVTLKEIDKYNEDRPLTNKEARQFAEALYDEYVDYIQSQMNWLRIGADTATSLDEKQQSREFFVERSRLLARREPVSKQAIRLYRSYSGILKIEFKSKDEQAVKAWKEKFWELRENKRILSPLYRGKLANRLLSDGELYFPLITRSDGSVIIRTIDPLQIPEDGLITHPEDDELVLYYKRLIPTKNRVNNKSVSKTLYYRDWLVTDEDISDARRNGAKLPKDEDIAKDSSGNPILMFHVPFDAFGHRGNGLLFAAISYIEAWRNFLQDRATIVRGLSTYIREITLKGGSKAVKDFAARFQSSLAQGLGVDNNPPDAVGSTWVQNQNATKRETPPVTNASEAMTDSRVFRQPIAAAVGITEANLIGDPSIGNLASQEQMEGVQLQNFQDFQQLWEEVFKELWGYVLRVNNMDESTPVDIDLPPILKIPATTLVQMLTFGMDRTLIPYDEAARQLLMAIGSNEIDDLINVAKTEKDEKKKEQQQQFGNPPQPGPQTQDNKEKPPQNNNKQVKQQERKLSEHEGIEVPGVCPFCNNVNCLIEDHNINYCKECEVSFDPHFFMVETVAESLSDRLYRRNGNGKY